MNNEMDQQSVFVSELFDRLADDWSGRRLKYLADIRFSNVDKKVEDDQKAVLLCNYNDVYKNDLITGSLDFMKATATSEEIAKFALRQDDVLITKDSETADDIGVPAIVAEKIADLVCGYHLSILRPGEQVFGRFLFRYLQSTRAASFFEKRANGITRFAIGLDAVGDCPVIFPSMQQQKSVASFLDNETARIDALISKKKRQVELLEEKRTAVITRAITKGLNSNAKMRDSGVEWIGEIPAHWQVLPIRRVVDKADYGISESLDASGEIPVLRMGNLTDGGIDLADLRFVDEVDKFFLLQKGDLLYNRTNSLDLVGKVGLFQGDADHDRVSFASYLVRIRTNDRAFPEYLTYLLNTPYVLSQARAIAYPSIGQANLSPPRYLTISVPLPPKEEQGAINRYLVSEDEGSHRRLGLLKRSIALLQELRSSLITAAVSGQIDVSTMRNGTGR